MMYDKKFTIIDLTSEISNKWNLRKGDMTFSGKLLTFYIGIDDKLTKVFVELPVPITYDKNYISLSDDEKYKFIERTAIALQDTAEAEILINKTKISDLLEQLELLSMPPIFNYQLLGSHEYGYCISELRNYFINTISTLNACDLGYDDPILNLLKDSKNIEIVDVGDVKNSSYIVGATLSDLVKATSEFFRIWTIDAGNLKRFDKELKLDDY
ncbi:MAG: hypothetical protein K0B07_01115 [DPANN group archaeon]|nr:hypothetical protein [DPANN group archaeon]